MSGAEAPLEVVEGGAGATARPTSGLPAITAPPAPAEWRAMRDQAEVIARSGLAPRAVSSPDKILVIALKGRELALPPMQALSHIHIVEGKPTLSAELMAALVQRAGHKLRVLETTNTRCIVEGVRADDPGHPSKVKFDLEDAKRAGVANKGPWKSYPAAMLRARAISALCRFQFADVLMGASYTPEELGADVNEDGEVVETDPRVEVEHPTLEAAREQASAAAAKIAEDSPAESEVVEESSSGLPPEHLDLIDQVDELLDQFEDGRRPDRETTIRYAEAKYGNAVQTVKRLEQLLELDQAEAAPDADASGESGHESDEDDHSPPPELPDDMRGAAKGASRQKPGERPARRSQVDLLKTLAEELRGEEGVKRLEDRVGRPLEQLTRDEADEWIDRLTDVEGDS